jgi:mono/diheme cytochrome c family protein
MSIQLKTLFVVLAMTGSFAVGVFGADGAAGKATYEKACKSCHGPDGSGNPAVAKMMKVEMHPLGSKEIQAKTDAELKTVITKGKGKMPAVAGVTDAQAADVAAFLRTLKK